MLLSSCPSSAAWPGLTGSALHRLSFTPAYRRCLEQAGVERPQFLVLGTSHNSVFAEQRVGIAGRFTLAVGLSSEM